MPVLCGSPAIPSRSRCSLPSSPTRGKGGRSWRTGSSGLKNGGNRRLAMTIGCPRLSESLGCMMRAVISRVPPGGKGTMNRIGLAGYCSDKAGAAAHNAYACTRAIIAHFKKGPMPVTERWRIALFWRLRHGRRMVIHDHPVFPLVDVGEAVSGRQGPGFAISDEGKAVVPGIDRGAAVNPDQLLPKCDFQPGKRFEGIDKIFAQGCGTGSHRWRKRSPEHGILCVKGKHFVGIVFC